MKNLFLSVVLLLTVSFAFAANDVEKVSTLNVEEIVELSTNSVEIADVDFTLDIEVEYTSFDASNTATYPCRWRTCTYINGVLQGCTAWTYGICVDLDEIVIK
jgi:hypothetical protein